VIIGKISKGQDKKSNHDSSQGEKKKDREGNTIAENRRKSKNKKAKQARTSLFQR
jgi:hypothetical protein